MVSNLTCRLARVETSLACRAARRYRLSTCGDNRPFRVADGTACTIGLRRSDGRVLLPNGRFLGARCSREFWRLAVERLAGFVQLQPLLHQGAVLVRGHVDRALLRGRRGREIAGLGLSRGEDRKI